MAISVANAIVAQIGADLSGFQKGVQEATGIARSTAKRIGRAFSVAGALITGYLTKRAIDAGRAIFDLGAGVVETRSKFLTVFGEASQAVDQFGQSFGRLAGLSREQFQSVAATTGAVVQGFGFAGDAATSLSTNILRLGGDLASFNNLQGGAAEATHILTRGLTGEFDSLKGLGIVIRAAEVDQRALTDTGKNSIKQLTEQERVTARMALITERAGVAVGDLARTQNSAANRARQLGAQINTIKENLAVAFLPVLSESILPALGDLVTKIEDNQDKIVRFGTAFIEVGKVLVTTAVNAFQIVGGILGDLGALIVGIFTFDFKLVKTAIVDLKDTTVDNVKEIVDAWSGLFTGLPQKLDDAVAALHTQTAATQTAAVAANTLSVAISDVTTQTTELKKVSDIIAENMPQIFVETATNVDVATHSSDRLISSLYDTVTAADSVAQGVKNFVVQLGQAVAKAIVLKAVMAAINPLGAAGGGGLLSKIPIIGGLFQQGGIVPGRGPVPIIAHGGEAVLTPEAVQRIGGQKAVEQINTGGGSTTSIERVELVFPNVNDPVALRRVLPGVIRDLQRKGRI